MNQMNEAHQLSKDEIVTKIMDLRQEIITIEIQRDNATESLKTQLKEIQEKITEIETPQNEDIEERRAEEEMLTAYLWNLLDTPETPTETEDWILVPKYTHGKEVDVVLANEKAAEMDKLPEFLKLIKMTQTDCKKFFGSKIANQVMIDKEPVFKGLELDLTETGLAKRLFYRK